jgi:hypothetical protein
MKLLKTTLLALSFTFIASCSGGGAFKSFQGELPPTEIATLNAIGTEKAQVNIISVNGTLAGNAASAMLKKGENKVVVGIHKDGKSLQNEFTLSLEGGKVYSTSGETWDVEYMPGNFKTKPIGVLYVKDASGSIIAGTDKKADTKDLK